MGPLGRQERSAERSRRPLLTEVTGARAQPRAGARAEPRANFQRFIQPTISAHLGAIAVKKKNENQKQNENENQKQNENENENENEWVAPPIILQSYNPINLLVSSPPTHCSASHTTHVSSRRYEGRVQRSTSQ